VITGIEHAAICAKNSTELKDWYKKVFGFQQVFENEEGTYFLKAQNGFLLEFIQETEPGERPGEKQGGIRHIALSVDEFDDMIELLIKEKVDFITDPVLFLNSLSSKVKGSRLFLFRDPEGNILHLTKRLQPL
jgi:catechol-2,3-dioxygenase